MAAALHRPAPAQHPAVYRAAPAPFPATILARRCPPRTPVLSTTTATRRSTTAIAIRLSGGLRARTRLTTLALQVQVSYGLIWVRVLDLRFLPVLYPHHPAVHQRPPAALLQ